MINYLFVCLFHLSSVCTHDRFRIVSLHKLHHVAFVLSETNRNIV